LTGGCGYGNASAGNFAGDFYIYLTTDFVLGPSSASPFLDAKYSTGDMLIGTATDNGTDKLQVNGSIAAAAATLGGGTKITGIKIGTGTLSAGTTSISDAAISTSSAVIVTHLGTSVTHAGALFAYPSGAGTATVNSANSSDNDTFTYLVVNH
jgi:hypothetical protein